MKIKSYSLAEVLITIGIIGLVASLTLPEIINNSQDKQFKTMFKKQASIISQAMQMIYVKEGEIYKEMEWRKISTYVCKLGRELKTTYTGLNCDKIFATGGSIDPNTPGLTNSKFTWHQDGQWYDKTGKAMTSNGAFLKFTFYLPDGAMINFNSVNQIFIDVNGNKKPNTIGRDIFYMVLKEDSMTPTFFKKDGTIIVNGYNCPEFCTTITRKNYTEDCKNGSGWGCSPMYILE